MENFKKIIEYVKTLAVIAVALTMQISIPQTILADGIYDYGSNFDYTNYIYDPGIDYEYNYTNSSIDYTDYIYDPFTSYNYDYVVQDGGSNYEVVNSSGINYTDYVYDPGSRYEIVSSGNLNNVVYDSGSNNTFYDSGSNYDVVYDAGSVNPTRSDYYYPPAYSYSGYSSYDYSYPYSSYGLNYYYPRAGSNNNNTTYVYAAPSYTYPAAQTVASNNYTYSTPSYSYYPTNYPTSTYYPSQPTVSNQVLSYTDTVPALESVYLSDIPSTGFDDYYKMLLFVSLLLSWSIIVSYIFLKRKIEAEMKISTETIQAVKPEDFVQANILKSIKADTVEINRIEDIARKNKILLSSDASAKIVKLSRLGKINSSEYISNLATGEWIALGESQII